MTWVEVIHNCPVPDEATIMEAEAQVGSVWQCSSTIPGSNRKCEDRWMLRQIKNGVGMRGAVGKFPKWDRLTVNGEEVPPRDR